MSKFLKKDLPQPKYKLGQVIVFMSMTDPPKKRASVIEEIMISITEEGKGIAYKTEFVDEFIPEEEVLHRVIT